MNKILNKSNIFIMLFLYAYSLLGIVEGTYPDNSNLKKYSVFGSVATTGNTMMATTPPGNVNDILLPYSSGDLTNLPYDAEIVAAHIFWSGSLGATLFTPDNNIKLVTKDGIIHDINADNCKVVTSMEGFYYCSSDITDIISNQNVFNYNGRYTVRDLKGDTGNCEENPFLCQAKYAAWSMVVIYKSKTSKVKREILLYDSFLHLDEKEDSIGITSFTINGLKVNSPARGEFTYFGLEGDRFLGVPPQDAPENQFPCPTCYDFIELNGIKLHDGLNPPNNIWNSSLATAVDIDTFRIGERGLNILRSGNNQSIAVRLGSGDGIIPNEHPEAGGGESVFLGYVLIALDTISPNFRTQNTNLIVDRSEAAQGDELTYILTVTNDGSQIAHNVRIQELIPPQTVYIPNSTYIDGVLTNNDINTPQGLNIGTLGFLENNKKIITFRVKVKDSVPDGTYIYNNAKIICDETENDPAVTNTVSTLINAPDLQTPILTVKDENQGDYLPGEWVEYTVNLSNTTNNPVSNIKYVNQLPSDFTQVILISSPFNSEDNSDIANKRIEIKNIEIPARSTVIIKYRAKIKTIEEYISSGVSEEEINNKEISNQGYISALNTQIILTDNDNGGNEHDPTVFRIKKEVNANFSESTMIVENMNGSNIFRPGDIVKYTITVKNSATATVNAINIFDDINENYFENITVNEGFYDGNQIKWFINSLAPNETKNLTFTAQIKKPQKNGKTVENQAIISVTGRYDHTDDPTTPQDDDPTKFVITADNPNFALSTKEVTDENGGEHFQQGDYVTYTITLKNSGEAIGENITVTDEISPYLTDIEVFNNGIYQNNKIIWSFSNNTDLISPSEDVILKFRAKIKTDTPDNTIVENQATIKTENSPVTFLTDDPTTSNISDSTKFTVKSAGEITESYKTYEDLNGANIEPGDDIKYTIEVRNTGNLAIHGARVFDNIDTDNLEDIRVENGGSYDNSTITWQNIGDIPPHSSIKVSFTAKIKENTLHNTEISNQAVIMSDEIPFALTDNPLTPQKDDPTVFKVNAMPELKFTKKVENLNNLPEFKKGDRIKYTIKIENNSNYETGNITITDIIPPELENITVSSNGIISGNTVYFYLQPSSLNTIMEIEGTIKENGKICNQALLEDINFNYTINSDDPFTEETGDKTCFVTSNDINITNFEKRVIDLNGSEFKPGDEIEYQLSFKNESDIPLNDIVIYDEIDENLTDISLVNGGIYDGQKIIFNSQNTNALNNIPPHTEITVKFRAKIKTPLENNTVISNRAQLNIENLQFLSDNPDTPDFDATTFTVVSAPDLYFTKEVRNLNGSDIYKAGDTIEYKLKIINSGTDNAQNIAIKDKIDDNLEYISSSAGIFDTNTKTLTVNSTTLPSLSLLGANDETEFTIKAKIKENVQDQTIISNRGILNSDNTPQVISDNPLTPDFDSTDILITENGQEYEFKAYKRTNKKTYKPGETVLYTIEIKNNSNNTVRNITVTDELSNKLTLLNASDNAQVNNGKVKWSYQTTEKLLSMAPNESITLRLSARIKLNTDDNTIISNRAYISSDSFPQRIDTDDPETPEFDTTDIIVARNKIKFTKEVSDENNDNIYIPNEDITYKIKVKNDSEYFTLKNIVIKDYFPFEKLELTDTHGLIINESTKEITMNYENFPELSQLPPLTEVELHLKAKIKDLTVDGTVIKNQAFLSFDNKNQNIPSDDPKTEEKDDATKFILSAKADLTDFTKTVRADNGFFPQSVIKYTLRVKNKGTATAKNLVINDSIDENLEILEAEGAVIENNNIKYSYENNENLLKLEAGKEIAFTIKAKIKENTPNNQKIFNQAYLSSSSVPYTEPSDNPITEEENDATVFKVINSPLLYATKTVIDLNGGVFEQGDIVRYIIKIYNKGNNISLNNIFRDTIPEYTEYIPDSTKLNDSGVPDENGLPPFIEGINIGDIEVYDNTDNTIKIVSFEVRISDNAPDGSIISNQAEISNNIEEILSDDPNTDEKNDATIFYVNRENTIKYFYKKAKVEDTNDDNEINEGDIITYEITLKTENIEKDLIIEDEIPENTEYISNSIILNGINQTDTADNDNAYISNGKIYFVIYPDMPSLTKIFFKVKIKGGDKVVNQAIINYNSFKYKSDNPTTPQPNDPTTVYLSGYQEEELNIKKTVKDLNGGLVLPGDILEYTIIINNTGNKKAQNVEITDDLPYETEYINNSEELSDIRAHFVYNPTINNGQIKIYGIEVDKGKYFKAKFKVKIKNDTKENTKIINTAQLNNTKKASAKVIIGAQSGTASIYGKLYYLDKDNDEIPLKNYKIEIKEIKKSQNLKTYSTLTNDKGEFEINGIKPSEYDLFYYNTKGTLFGHQKLNYLKPENDNKLNLLFIPTGFIYDSETNEKIEGARIFIYRKHADYDTYETNCFNLDLIETEYKSQQGQITEANGLYKFDINNTEEENLGICIMAYPDYTFPSETKKPSSDNIEYEDGYIPDEKYYIEFQKNKNLGKLQNNNIPLDPISESLKITKIADQKFAYANSIVTYRITALNKSRYFFENEEGVYIYDILPKNFKLINNSYKITITNNGKTTLKKDYGIEYKDRILILGPLNFTPGDKIEISYRLAVGSNVERGKYENTAYITNNHLKKLSDEAKAYITINYDFDFDMGAVIGKVYCDDNKNNRQDLGESGLQGVNIYNDEGFVSTTDKNGKFHFTVLNPGLHLIKLDKNTLLPGIKPIEEKRIIRITQGLLHKVNFPLNCDEINKDKNFIVQQKEYKTKNNIPEELITLRGNINKRIFIGNHELSIKEFKLKQNKKLITEDEDIVYDVSGTDKNQLINYYIYRFDKDIFTNETTLNDLYRFEQRRGNLKIKLPAGKYLVFAEIPQKDKIYRTSPLISFSQRIPNQKGEGLIEFKKTKFEFNPVLFINGKKVEVSKTGKLFKIYHIDNLKNASVLYKNNKGESVNFILKTNKNKTSDNKKLFLSDNNYLKNILKIRKNEIKTNYDDFGKDEILNELGVKSDKGKTVKNFYGVRLSLPQDNSIIYSDYLYLKGYLPPKYKMEINDIQVKPYADGYFDFKLKVNPDLKEIKVKVTDDKGKTGTLTRKIKVSDTRYFLMAFSDTELGHDKGVTSDSPHTYIPDSKVYLQGKAVLYFKGRISGKTLRKYIKKYFKNIEATLYFNSSKKKEYEEFYVNLINPERFYPVYGDTSYENQEIKTRGKLYVKIKFDDSTVLWGNYKTIIHNSDLVEYDKTLYGLLIDFNKTIKNIKTQDTVYYSGDKLSSRNLYNEFQGTGGSLYYLQSAFIKEGSQTVKIIIRDRETGIEIYKKILIPNIDYTINYATGTILLKEPLPSFVDSNFITNGKLSDNSLSGNPIYLAVSYQADTNFNINSDSTFGFTSKQEYKNIFITAHALKEKREIGSHNTDYSLSGMGIGYKYSNNTYIFAEMAHSKNYDKFSFLSKDGGITFKPTGEEFGNVSGNAFLLKLKLALRDFNIKNKILNSMTTIFNYQKQSKYFYKTGNRIGENQGGDKITLISNLKLSNNKDLKLRYFGIITDYNTSADTVNQLTRHQITLRYNQKINSKTNFSIEHQGGYTYQNRDENLNLGISEFKDDFITNITSFMYQHQINKDLSLSLQQSIIEQYDKRIQDFTTGDRFMTGIGADYLITDNISLHLFENVKFSGDNSTIAGLKYKIDDNSSMYINQKWLNEDQGLTTTLLGAQTNLGEGGKLYGEYQLNKSKVTNDRALLGIGKTYKINNNISIQGGFEHTFYQSYNAEKQSRSAISLGLNFKFPEKLSGFTKHELRYDNFTIPRFHYLTTNGLTYDLSNDLMMLAKANLYITENLDENIPEARMSEVSLGFALRPASYDFINILGKYSLISQLRPLNIDNNHRYEEAGHVLSSALIYEAPFKLELTEKLAFKYAYVSEDNTDSSLIMTLLWINRLAYHMIEKFDIAFEYRIRKMINFDMSQGFLLEGAYKIKKYFYLGAGYNFTSFTDDVFYMNDDNFGGFFIRINGYF